MREEPDDLDVDFDEPEDDTVGCTILRAAVRRDGDIAMAPWLPGLAEGGPAGMHFRSRERAGVAIADLRLIRSSTGEREVIVEFMAAGRVRKIAETSICAWARSTGHGRVWLPSGPIDLDPPPPLATATVRCPTCRATWVDSTPAFWDDVHHRGHFPLLCPTCAHPLPQWKVAEGDATRCRGD